MSKFDTLNKLCAPKKEPLSTGAMVFFAQLDDSDTASDPSNEQVETIQSLIDTSRELDETKSKLEVKDLDKSMYFDADDKEEPLASSPLKPVEESKIKEWIKREVNEAVESGSQASNSKNFVPSKTKTKKITFQRKLGPE